MDKLTEAREVINGVDQQIAKLFMQRMNAVRQIAEYKKERGLPIFDANRERGIIEKNSAYIDDEEIKSYYVTLQQEMMRVSRHFQEQLIGGMRVAYSGVEGAFANIAARRIFPKGRHTGYSGFQAAYDAVVNGECDCAVLPFENSYAGPVDQVLDLMAGGPLHINGVYRLSVIQNLLGIPGTSIKDIRRVISHPQALGQCEKYISRHLFETIAANNTAVAAKKVADMKDPTIAAIASVETAELYGLEVLDHNINESAVNTTKFAVFSRIENRFGSSRGRFILIFTLTDAPGALVRAINVISDHGFNMRVLRSHNVKGKNWQYYFYIEADGDITNENGQQMLRELTDQCENLKVVGHYAQDVEL